MDRGVRVALSLEWRPVWQIPQEQCSSRAHTAIPRVLWRHVVAPSQSQGRKEQLQPKVHTTESSYLILMWHTARPPWSPGGSARTKYDREMGSKTEDSSPKVGKEKYRKTGHCQLLSE